MTDILKQIRFLESQDTKSSDDARQALAMQISLGNGISQLVAYYAEHRSERALDLLCKIKEPHDKTLLDTLVDTIREKKCQETLILLGQIVQQAPSWTPKIAMHSIFRHILEHIRAQDVPVSDSISGLLFVSLLLPHCSGLTASHLHAMFTTFLACAVTYRKKLREMERKRLAVNHVERINIYHLGFAIREFFQTLYGIYPANFVHFLRNYFSNDKKEKLKIVETVILPLLNGVRLHPSLVLSSKEKEIAKERWAHKEAHDFLDECRRVIIGLIPMPVVSDADRASVPDSPPVMSQALLSQLFPSEHSSSSSNIAWNDTWSEMDATTSLIESINTPPGSFSATPTQKRSTVDEGNLPMVITSDDKEKRRRSTGESRKGLRFSFNSMFRRHPERRSNRAQDTLIEVVPAEEEHRRISETEDVVADEAEEAMDCITPVEDPTAELRRGSEESVGSSSRVAKVLFPSPKGSAASSRKTSKADTEQEMTPVPTRNEIAEEARMKTNELFEAKEKALHAIRTRSNRNTQSDSEENNVVRSRSTSFLFGAPEGEGDRERTSTMDTGNMERTENSENGDLCANDSMDGGRSRFSVTSYFSRLNRQRFVSECPTLDAEQLGELETKQGPRNTIDRWSSCPNIAENALRKEPAEKVRAAVESQVSKTSRVVSPLEKFPYLKLIEPLEAKYYDQLEAKLENDHDQQREAYMKASSDFHSCLKELSLADRLPGRIYDDMGHITQGLPVEKQRDILRTRLQLVNQHLLYERSCRLLHANRNRRLFGKIKQQKVTDAELVTLKENLHEKDKERGNLRKALSEKRRELDAQRREFEERQTVMDEAMKQYEKKYNDKCCELAETRERMEEAERYAKKWSGQMDAFRRRAEDAEEVLRLYKGKMEILQQQTSELKSAQSENQQLRDQVSMSDFRRDDDRLRSPDGEDRQTRQLQMELERMRTEREQERLANEELRERLNDMEVCFKQECVRSSELKGMLERSARLLCEQNEAAEQKFLSLQAVTQRQEEHICELYARLEAAFDSYSPDEKGGSRDVDAMIIPRSGIPPEIRSYESTTSEPAHSYFIRDTPVQSTVQPTGRGSLSSSEDNEMTM